MHVYFISIFGLHRFLWRILLLSLTIFADICRFVLNMSPKHSLLLHYECFQKNELKHVYTANWTKYAMNACKIYKKRFCIPFSGIPVKIMNLRNEGKVPKFLAILRKIFFSLVRQKFSSHLRRCLMKQTNLPHLIKTQKLDTAINYLYYWNNPDK